MFRVCVVLSCLQGVLGWLFCVFGISMRHCFKVVVLFRLFGFEGF